MSYYKVLFKEKLTGRLWSTNLINNDSGMYQEYFWDVWNKPKFLFPILAFNSLLAAKEFNHRNFDIAEVDGVISRTKVTEILDVGWHGGESISDRVIGKSISRMISHYKQENILKIFSPYGTVGLSCLKLIRILERSEYEETLHSSS